MELLLIPLLIAILVLGGAICGISALVRVIRANRRLDELQADISMLKRMTQTRTAAAPPPLPTVRERAETDFAAPASAPEEVRASRDAVAKEVRPEQVTIEKPTLPPLTPEHGSAGVEASPSGLPPRRETVARASESSFLQPSLEMMLGTKGIVWVGMVMFLIGSALFLKYAYDNAWIGPEGRLAIGVAASMAALGLGERFRRRAWPVLFQTFTGGGIAGFYICVFFSFQVYHLSSAPASMVLAALVTVLAVVMAVAHNAVSVAIIAVIGGFLSPVLLSTGENHPYGLFTYIAILDLAAVGAAYYRRWRALDVLCFAGTCLLYLAWREKHYAADQLAPAMIYASLFYVMFLVIPSLYGLTRRVTEGYEGLTLIAANAAFSFYCYYSALFDTHRYTLGFVVLGQALLVFLLFQLWAARVGKENATSQSLLVISLALVTIAVPIQLKAYGVPIAWAMEGAVFAYLGVRFKQVICRMASVAALLLAAAGLCNELPLHRAAFTPVFNAPFLSWVMVAAATVIAAYLLRRAVPFFVHENVGAPLAVFLLAFVQGCAALTLEVDHYWRFSEVSHHATHALSSRAVLWALIALATATVIKRYGLPRWMPLAWAVCAVGVWMFLVGCVQYHVPSTWLMLNTTFLPKLFFIIVLWWIARLSRFMEVRARALVPELAGHALLTLLLAVEMNRWAGVSELVSQRIVLALISAAWALQAFALIWYGLWTRVQARRIAGFVLFAVTALKVLLLDTSQLEQVYRIVSWLASGACLLVAAYFYHRYSALLLGEAGKEEKP